MFDFVDDLFRSGHVWTSRVLDQRNDMIVDLVECVHVVHGVCEADIVASTRFGMTCLRWTKRETHPLASVKRR